MSLTGWLLLLVLVAAIGYVVLRRRPSGGRLPTRGPGPPSSDDDLASLGLSEVRVRGSEPEAAETGAPPARPAPAPPRARPAEARPVEARPAEAPEPAPAARRVERRAAPVRKAVPGPYVREGARLWPRGSEPAAHLLASLAEHVGGSAAVLRYDAGTDAYVVEALAGPPVDDAPTPIPAPDCPLHRAPQDRVLTVLPAAEVGAFRELGAERGGHVYARAVDEPPAARAFLVVSVPGAELDRPALERLSRYADLLADLTALDLPHAAAGPERDESERDGPPAAPTAVPRAAIIREEQDAAAEADRPLAFALVTLADAESLLEGDPAELARAEADLRDRLAHADGVRRVEPFGDLLFGAFLDLDPAETAEWCGELASGEPPLFIGAVAPAEAEPEAVRDAAAAALRDAYDQRRAQVVEA